MYKRTKKTKRYQKTCHGRKYRLVPHFPFLDSIGFLVFCQSANLGFLGAIALPVPFPLATPLCLTSKALSTLSQKSATVAENGETTAKFGDCRTFLRQCGQALRRKLKQTNDTVRALEEKR